MKCDKCGYDCQGTGDFAHVCSARNGGVLLQDLIAEMEQTTEGKVAMEEGRKWVRETIAAQAAGVARKAIASVKDNHEN